MSDREKRFSLESRPCNCLRRSWVVNNVISGVIFGVALALLNPFPSAGLAFEHVAFFHLGDENLKFAQSFGVSQRSRDGHPHIRINEVPLDALSLGVKITQAKLGSRIPLLRRFPVPFGGFYIILWDSRAILVDTP